MTVKRTRITASRFSPTNKNLELQTLGAGNEDVGGGEPDSDYAPHFGEWCLIAPPLAPSTDGKGNISATCDALGLEIGDDVFTIGTRDVRSGKYGQDLKGGECALINTDGTRLAFKHESCALIAFGGFLCFDKSKKSVGLAGIPDAPGKAVPYLTIGEGQLGLVSASGAASVAVGGSQVSISGAAVSLDAGGVALGKGATDGVVLVTDLAAVCSAVNAWVKALQVAGGATVAVPPLVLAATGSTRVKAAH